MLWLGSPNGTFSVSRAWEDTRNRSTQAPWYRVVWFKGQVPRHAFILWLAVKRRLCTLDRMVAQGIAQESQCLLCGVDAENHDHLFFQCPFSNRIWLTFFPSAEMSLLMPLLYTKLFSGIPAVRVHGQHTPKAPTFRLQPIQPQPNLHEIQQPKLLVVPRGRHPPIIVSSTEQASHRSGERKGPPLKKKVTRLTR